MMKLLAVNFFAESLIIDFWRDCVYTTDISSISFRFFMHQKPDNIITYFCKLKVTFLESAQISFSNFSETINREVFRTLSTNEHGALCENS